MQRGRLLLAAGLFAVASGVAVAGDEPEAPGKAVSRLARDFSRLKSYAADVSATGGTGDPKTLRVTTPTANESYQGQTLGTVTKIGGSVEAFRFRGGAVGTGAVHDGAAWKAILATDGGRKAERLFVRPEQLMVELERSKKTAQWIPPAAGAGAPAPEEAPPAPTVEEPKDGKTHARDAGKAGKTDGAAAPAAPVSHHLRVVGDPQIAVETFNRVVSSGCFSGG